MIKVEYLDKRICDVCSDSLNTQTYREFIRESEEELGLECLPNLDFLEDWELDDYIEFLDELWNK